MLIGQALARPANFINQELYGPPTQLPWGIPIDAAHRLAQYADLSKYPVDATRFHPTFAYDMLLNIPLALLLLRHGVLAVESTSSRRRLGTHPTCCVSWFFLLQFLQFGQHQLADNIHLGLAAQGRQVDKAFMIGQT